MQPFGMPLDTQQPGGAGAFNGFNQAISSQGAYYQSVANIPYGLMMSGIHPEQMFARDAMQQSPLGRGD